MRPSRITNKALQRM